jgi:hypothetical protein
MHVRVSPSVEDGQQDQTYGTPDRKEDGNPRASLVKSPLVWHQFSCMSKPTFRHKCKIEEDNGDDTAGNKEGLEPLGSNVGDITRANN